MSDRSAVVREMLVQMRADGHTIGSLGIFLGVPLVVMRRVASGDTHVAFEEFRKIRQWVETRSKIDVPLRKRKQADPDPAPSAPRPALVRPVEDAPVPVEQYLRSMRPVRRYRNTVLIDRDLEALQRRVESLVGLIQHQGKQIDNLLALLKGETACQASMGSSLSSPSASL